MNITSRLAIYDPLRLPESDFLQSFIARQDTLQRQLRHITNNNNATMTRHSLVIGQRGMGKTSLLRRIALAVRDDPTLSQHWIPLNFREEQYNVARLPQLWVNCADALADWCQQQGDDDSANALDDAQEHPDRVWQVIKAVTLKHERRLLLLIDNLNLIFDNLSEQDQWELRGTLQHRDGPMLLACSSVVPDELSKREGAFYEFVSLEKLQGLHVAELRQCLHTLATIRGDAGKQVLEQLHQQPHRVEVLHTLCGGNPRTLIVIYQVLESLAISINQDSSELLEAVLESTTPLYKARTEELSQQQRRVFDAIALHWDPIHSSRIFELTGLPSTSVSPQLKRLEHDGIIEKVPMDGKRKGYQLIERFYNIWYLMRHGNRRSSERLRWLTQFLMLYYDKSERDTFARRFIQSPEFERTPVSEALVNTFEEGSPVREALMRQLSRGINISADELLLNKGSSEYSTEILSHTSRQAKIIKGLESNVQVEVDAKEFANLVARSYSLSVTEKDNLAKAIPRLSQSQVDSLIAIFTDEYKRLHNEIVGSDYELLAPALQSGKITGLDDIRGAVALFETCNNAKLQYVILAIFSKITDDPQLKTCTLAPFPADTSLLDASTLNGLGNLLQDHLNRFDESEQAYRRAIEIDPKYAYPWNGLGNLLKNHLNRFDEAEQAYRRAIEIDPKDASPWNGLGNLLKNHLNRFDEAEQAYRRAIEIDPKYAYSWNGLGNLLLDCKGQPEAAHEAWQTSIELDSTDARSPKANMAWAALFAGNTDACESALEGIQLPEPGLALLQAGMSVCLGNPGEATNKLKEALSNPSPTLWSMFGDDLLRLTRLFKQHSFDDFYLDWLKKQRLHIKMAPYVTAVRAFYIHEDELKLASPEVRQVAEPMYTWLNMTHQAWVPKKG